MTITMWIEQSLPLEAFPFFLSFHILSRNGNIDSSTELGEVEAEGNRALFLSHIIHVLLVCEQIV